MNATHLHLLLNHFPIIGTLIGAIIIIYGFIKRDPKIKNLASLLIVIMSLIALPVFFTGEPAEEYIENIQGISEATIEKHEEAAEFAIVIMSITGFLALLSLFFNKIKPEFGNKFSWIVLVMTIVSFISMANVGFYGGKIRHTELNGTLVNNQAQPSAVATEEEED